MRIVKQSSSSSVRLYIRMNAIFVTLAFLHWSKPIYAAAPQYIQIVNQLASLSSGKNPGVTATDIILNLYNGGTIPCFSVHLEYGLSVTLATGGRSPCVAPVTQMSVHPLPTPFGDIYAPLSSVAVDSSHVNFVMTVKSSVDPVFNTQNGAIVSSGTGQISFAPM